MNTVPLAPAVSGYGPLSLLTVAEVAAALNMPERAVRHLIAKRELPVVRVSRNVRIRYRDLERWVDARTAGGTQ